MRRVTSFGQGGLKKQVVVNASDYIYDSPRRDEVVSIQETWVGQRQRVWIATLHLTGHIFVVESGRQLRFLGGGVTS